MTGNDQKSVWEYHLGAETIHFGDLGCPGRYSGVLEGDFHVDSQNPKVPEREAKKQVSKKLRLRLARGVEINSE